MYHTTPGFSSCSANRWHPQLRQKYHRADGLRYIETLSEPPSILKWSRSTYA